MSSNPLKGKKIVLTGKFTGLSRKAAGVQLKALGATVSGSVSSKTDILIAGRASGSKLYKAHKNNVLIFGEPHLTMLLAGTPLAEVSELAGTFYTVEYHRGAPPEGVLSVIGGAAPGVSLASWPTDYGEEGRHLFTLDLSSAPALKVYYPSHRTLSLFSRKKDPEMYDMSRPYSSLVFQHLSDEAEVAAWSPEVPDGHRSASYGWLELVKRDRSELSEHFGSTRILGNVPLWCQSEEHQDTFLMQFGEGYGISGDGLVYLFTNAAFAQFT